ncbi:hypothetical protein CSE16_13615 [Solibacillus sp. R5-41]|uniref:DUF2268 domain-containing putative Zn-dependent protease n=1 Tax=Solibacillus sp. R5-41 TaxID=2048654 RepID=UPI000C124944|nr:DUF2268 domain-containing putative Zn-dependent protease [Solibacillus sp. R5-41]ATP41006.1 hypothetical protein CSE16_13615 [Solibacillus sp. R5-41]
MDKVELLNLVPKFLAFYQMANKSDIDKEKRWTLWEEHYNFAAVPPGEEGKVIARNLLEGAWESYSEHLLNLEQWEPNQERINHYLAKIKALLGYDQPINLVVVYFVGGFENNPFVAPFDEKRLALCLPIENGDSDILLSHELTHIVHSHTANLTAKWERTIASTIIQEGLATQVSKFLVPGDLDEHYIEHKKGWFETCNEHKWEIIKGTLPFLEDSSSEAVTRFTFGNGTTNNEREVYFVGWEIVQYLLGEGVSFKELATIQEGDIPNYLREVYPLFLTNEVVDPSSN